MLQSICHLGPESTSKQSVPGQLSAMHDITLLFKGKSAKFHCHPRDGAMICHATQMLLDDTFCRLDDPSSNASLASEKIRKKKKLAQMPSEAVWFRVVGRKRNQKQHTSSAHDCRLGALLWHQMVDRRSTWGKSDSSCQPADLGWPKRLSQLE